VIGRSALRLVPFTRPRPNRRVALRKARRWFGDLVGGLRSASSGRHASPRRGVGAPTRGTTASCGQPRQGAINAAPCAPARYVGPEAETLGGELVDPGVVGGVVEGVVGGVITGVVTVGGVVVVGGVVAAGGVDAGAGGSLIVFPLPTLMLFELLLPLFAM
jgi:hypothetical protein